jgi:hypothetical protein
VAERDRPRASPGRSPRAPRRQPLRDEAVEAQKAKNDADVKRLRDKVVAWGFPRVVEDSTGPQRAAADVEAAAPASAPGRRRAPDSHLRRRHRRPTSSTGPGTATSTWDATAQAFEGPSRSPSRRNQDGALYLQINDGVDRPLSTSIHLRGLRDRARISCGSSSTGTRRLGAPRPRSRGSEAGEWKRFVIPVASAQRQGDQDYGIRLPGPPDLDHTPPLHRQRRVPERRGRAPPPPPAAGAHSSTATPWRPAAETRRGVPPWTSRRPRRRSKGSRSISLATHQMAAGLYIALDRSVDPPNSPT